MRFSIAIVAVLSVALITVECSAEPPGRQRGEKGKNGTAQRGDRAKGARGQGQQRDPAEMATKMMKEFDKDGDSKLNPRELLAMLTSMQERRAAGGKPGADGQRKGPGQKPEGAGKGGPGGKRQGNKPAGGGKKPKRPAAE